MECSRSDARVHATGGWLLPPGGGERCLYCSSLEIAKDQFDLLKIQNDYKVRPLSHRDYLGALMALGIKREKFSDVFIQEDLAYVGVLPELTDHLLGQLTKVANNKVTVTLTNPEDLENFEPNQEEEIHLVASLRLDVVVAELSKQSRSRVSQTFSQGKVLVNYQRTEDKSKTLKMGDVITIRGVGKFIIDEVAGETKKGRLRLKILRYL